MFSVFWGAEDAVTDYAGAQRQRAQGYRGFFHSMLEAGIALPPSAYEAWFLSAAHDQATVDVVLAALPAAAMAAARALDSED